MIKQAKQIKLIKNFKMEYPQTIFLPQIIKDSDISAMFCGLIGLIKSQTKFKLKQEHEQTYTSYRELLKMYKLALKKMNMYKTLYFKAIENQAKLA